MTRKRNKQIANGAAKPRRPARTAEDLARYKAIRERFQREKPSLHELVSSGEYNEPLPMGEYLSIRQAVFALKKAREARGFSLADVAERTGIDKAALSRIETGQHMNPTVSTLCRYAHSLGKRWKWILEEEVEDRMSVTITSEQLRECARSLQGKPLHKLKWDPTGTPFRGDPFRVEKVEGDSIFFDPAREPRPSGHTRYIQEQICQAFNDTHSLDPSAVKKAMAKKNHWYLAEDLALIAWLLAARVRQGQTVGLPGIADGELSRLADMVRGQEE